MDKVKAYDSLRQQLDNDELTQKGFDARVKDLLSVGEEHSAGEGTSETNKGKNQKAFMDEIIKLLFYNGFKQREMCSFLRASGYKVSERHLRRLIKSLGLRRRSFDRPHNEIRQAVMSELRHWSPWQGIRAMHKRVRDVRGIQPCYRNDVAVIMRELDSSGLLRRCPGKKRIERRNYFSRGPNNTWHIDGNDKLKFFGIWVHLGIDGFSRKIIWLKAGISNRQQTFIARYFFDAIQEHGGCPRFIRADRGKENLLVGQMQMAFHFRESSDQGRDSFRVGTSVHNQRAECFNSILKKTWIKKWQVTFEAMMVSGMLDLDNPVHINCLQYTHLPLLERELNMEQRLWNTHDIRKQRNVPGPFGKPDLLFTSPPEGFADMLCKVDDDLLQYAEQLVCHVDEPLLVANSAFRTISEAILQNSNFPPSPDGSFAAYLMLAEKFTTVLETKGISIPSTFAEANEIYQLLASESWTL